jgi:hypothetical protein
VSGVRVLVHCFTAGTGRLGVLSYSSQILPPVWKVREILSRRESDSLVKEGFVEKVGVMLVLPTVYK